MTHAEALLQVEADVARLAESRKTLLFEQEQAVLIVVRHDLEYKLSKAESEIEHYTDLANKLLEQRNKAQAELDSINRQVDYQTIVADPLAATFDPRIGTNADQIEWFMDVFAKSLDDTRTAKQKQADLDKLNRKRDTLQNKIINIDNKIFSAQQRIEKARFDAEDMKRRLA